ncbi:MAG: hypothetical protein ABIJ09_19135 [Pseudomonadota bacterium]
MALLMVLMALALLSAVVGDFAYNQHVKFMVSARERDALKAHYLARSGVELARLLLFFQDQIQPALDMAQQTGMLPFGEFVVWKLIPLDSELLCGVTGGQIGEALGFDMESARESLGQRREMAREKMSLDDEIDPKKFSLFDDKSAFCDMGGTFKVEITDEDSKLSLRRWETEFGPAAAARRDLLYALFLPARYDFLFEEEDSHGQRSDRWDVIAALRDWIDRDQNMTDAKAPPERFARDVGGSEDSSYDQLDPPYKAKNAYFDSHDELHLVRGFDDEMFDTFAPALTIYSDGKVNIKSATNPTVLIGLIVACAQNPQDFVLSDPAWLIQTLLRWQEYRQLGMLGGYGAVSGQGWMGFLQSQGLTVDTARCESLISEQSMFFTIKATAQVGDVERSITTVVRVFRSNEEMYYWREE